MAEHQAPEQIDPHRLGDYLEVMSKSVFQSGISWRVVDSKWTGIRDALWGFDATRIANSTPEDLDQLMSDARLIRHRKKLEAIVENARRMIELEESHGSLRNYLRSNGDFERVVKDLRKRFKFLGDMGCYHFLYVVGEAVPSYEQWCRSRGR